MNLIINVIYGHMRFIFLSVNIPSVL